MPELPEVESIKIQLERFLVGHVVRGIDIRNIRYELENKEKLLGSRITGVRRFGKVLVIDLSNNISIVVHVKMTGQFIYRGPNLKTTRPLSKKVVGGIPILPSDLSSKVLTSEETSAEEGKHTHVIFNLDRKGILYFNDYRRFGWMELIQKSKVKSQKFIKKLGPEFLKDMEVEVFMKILKGTKRAIKILLMDQEKMAGVGNIYANDALWLAKIDPKKPANELSKVDATGLYKSLETVLKEGIKRGGASELAFVTPDGSEGNYQNFTLVYGKENLPCKVCKTPIKKIKLGTRGTYFCPFCQRSV